MYYKIGVLNEKKRKNDMYIFEITEQYEDVWNNNQKK